MTLYFFLFTRKYIFPFLLFTLLAHKTLQAHEANPTDARSCTHALSVKSPTFPSPTSLTWLHALQVEWGQAQALLPTKERRHYQKIWKQWEQLNPEQNFSSLQIHFLALFRQQLEILPKIREFILAQDEPAKQRYFKKIYAAIWSLMTHHLDIFIKGSQVQSLDLGRYEQILTALSVYDSSNVAFSLYKVKRAIEGRFSLKEFTLCK